MATKQLAALARMVAAMGDDAVAARCRPPVEARLEAIRAERPRASRGVSPRRTAGVALAIGAAAAAVLAWPRQLTFSVGTSATAGQSGAWIVAPPAEALPIQFSDGSRVRLDGGSRVRVIGVTPRGARVAVERGTVSAEVVHRAGNDWAVVGGPFEIQVTGTRFDAAWDPETETLRVDMREGRVVVRAACLDRERSLVGGEAASFSCAAPKEAMTEPVAAPSSATASATAAPTMAAPEARALPAAVPSRPTEVAPPARASWRELAGSGTYQAAVAAAEAEGWDALCEKLSAADLLELGTVARLAGRDTNASQAYSAVRRRFVSTDAAAKAAFHLGRMAFDGPHAFAEAHRWFTVYLAERPDGGLAAEALGRAMEAEQRMGDSAGARKTAAIYLARHPAGAHTDLAKSILTP